MSVPNEVLNDPVKFYYACWPHGELYNKQEEILWSLRDNDETIVPAGNGLGKDYISAVAALWFFCSRRPARVVTTSVQFTQLNDVLWGEIRRLIATSKIKLAIDYTEMKIRQVYDNGDYVPLCEIQGQCVSKNEGLLGRHLPNDKPRTLVIFDEASGISDGVYNSTDTWTHRKLIIGNPFPCNNFFYRGVKAGDQKSPDGKNFYRKVIRIKAEDSPNVRMTMAQIKNGKKPTFEVLIPGLVDYRTYMKRRETWDVVRQCIGLDGSFYEGPESLLFPPQWLDNAEGKAKAMDLNDHKRYARVIGIDPAEGGDNTVWAIADEYGLIELISEKTKDTSGITGKTIDLMRHHNVPANKVAFDAGGGGKQHADRLRSQGYKVQTVAFGGGATAPRRRGLATLNTRNLQDETRYVYKNRRAEMYGMLSLRLDPEHEKGFAIPQKYTELRRQLAVMPRHWDAEGRLVLPPKRKNTANSTEETLTDLIGCSPDEADATVLAVFMMDNKVLKTVLTMG